MLSIDSSMVASSCLAPPVAIKVGKGNDEPPCAEIKSNPYGDRQYGETDKV